MNEKWQAIYNALSAPFSPEAFEADDSRGFTLTGIKGAYIIERLNLVLGPCGLGWRFTWTETNTTEREVNLMVTLTILIDGVWSEPIMSTGNMGIVKANLGDALKGALTDGLKKAASFLGVGIDAYKGLIEVGRPQAKAKPSPATIPGVTKGRVPGVEQGPLVRIPAATKDDLHKKAAAHPKKAEPSTEKQQMLLAILINEALETKEDKPRHLCMSWLWDYEGGSSTELNFGIAASMLDWLVAKDKDGKGIKTPDGNYVSNAVSKQELLGIYKQAQKDAGQMGAEELLFSVTAVDSKMEEAK